MHFSSFYFNRSKLHHLIVYHKTEKSQGKNANVSKNTLFLLHKGVYARCGFSPHRGVFCLKKTKKFGFALFLLKNA
jgi:hypothetical protein